MFYEYSFCLYIIYLPPVYYIFTTVVEHLTEFYLYYYSYGLFLGYINSLQKYN